VGRSRKNKPIIEKLVITDVAAEGKSLGKVSDKVVFVPLTIPGDIVDVQVTRKRSNYYEGNPIKFHHYSDIRLQPFCIHFGVCGRCKWQPLPYDQQVFYKHREVFNNLTRIGKIDLPEIPAVIPSGETRFYRNKLEFTFSNKRWLTREEIASGNEIHNSNGLGFHVQGMFDKVVDIDYCYLQPEPSNSIRLAIKEYALEQGLTFNDIRSRGGYLRTLIVRGTSTGETMVMIAFGYDDSKTRDSLFNHLKNLFPEVNSWMYVINTKANDSYSDLDVMLFEGRDHIIEEMNGLKFKIGPKSFFQTNSTQALVLYNLTKEFAGLTGSQTVYDLYTGTGTIANFVARQASKVVGIDNVTEAIESARENSRANGISNTTFIAGEVKALFNQGLLNQFGHPDVIITDPPRSGMQTEVIDTILYAAPSKIVYVSCNPATQARDLNLLDAGYRVTRVQPVDMFPHTHHIENVVLLEKR